MNYAYGDELAIVTDVKREIAAFIERVSAVQEEINVCRGLWKKELMKM